MPDIIRNNTEKNRFELDADGHTAVALYRLAPGTITIYHTQVDPEVEGRGIGSRLVHASLDEVRRLGLKLVPGCSFVRNYVRQHPEFNDLLK
jgi:predicted GNAT family acetyltransferase